MNRNIETVYEMYRELQANSEHEREKAKSTKKTITEE